MQRKADLTFELWYKLFFGVDKTSCKLALYLQSSTTSWLNTPSPVCHVNFYRWLCLVLSCLSSVEPAGELVFIVLTPGYLSRLLKEALLIVLLVAFISSCSTGLQLSFTTPFLSFAICFACLHAHILHPSNF